MKRKMSFKRTILFVSLAMLLTVVMLVGTTFAWFTDSVSSVNNIIKSGNLDVVLEYSTDGEVWAPVLENAPVFTETLWEPGHTQAVALRVKNVGTLALKYNLSTVVASEIGSVNVNDEVFMLSDFLDVYASGSLQTGVASTMLTDRQTALNYAVNDMRQIDFGMNISTNSHLLPGESHEAVMVITMPESVGNEANHKKGEDAPSITFGINLMAAQLPYESDSFGNDYDANVKLPVETVAVMTAKELQSALAAGKSVRMVNDITFTQDDLLEVGNYFAAVKVSGGNEVLLDLNGHDLTFCDAVNGGITFGFYVEDATIDIVGEGTVTHTAGDDYMFWARVGSTINISGGDYKCIGSTCIMYASGNNNGEYGVINVYGGSYENATKNSQSYMNIQNHGNGRINLYGGTFIDYDPVNAIDGNDKAFIKVVSGSEVVTSVVDGHTLYTVQAK